MNFCSQVLGTKLESSCICADGFEVMNLLEVENSKSMSFQAERFTRSPAFVTLYFPIPIQIKFIVVTPFIGQQCARIIQLYTLHSSKVLDISSLQASDVTFRSATAELDHPCIVCFRNPHYMGGCNLDDSPAIDEQHQVVDLQGKLHHVVAVKIGIMSMCSGSVPSIRRLKIWAVPSKSCGKNTIEIYKKKWRDYKNKTCLDSSERSAKPESATLENSEAKASSTGDIKPALPKELFDPLTFALMKNPVLLPGGQTVDRTTLDKHILTQAEWGRPPTDPFTGIAFTESYQPIPNVNLKLKLDQHFMNNSPAKSTIQHILLKPKEESKNLNRATQNRDCLPNDATSVNSSIGSHAENINQNFDHTTNKQNTRILRIPHSSYNPLRCCKCKSLFSSLTTQYLLPCVHKLCRSCLLSTSLVCPQCGKKFERKDVSRTFS